MKVVRRSVAKVWHNPNKKAIQHNNTSIFKHPHCAHKSPMLVEWCLPTNDPAHDVASCTVCKGTTPSCVHLGVYKCGKCDKQFHCKRLGLKHCIKHSAAGAVNGPCARSSKRQRRHPVPRSPKLGLQPAIREYMPTVDRGLHTMIGRVCRIRPRSGCGIVGPLLGYVVSALSPCSIKVEVLTLQAGKVGEHQRRGMHRDGRQLVTVAQHEISILDASIDAETQTELASVLLFDLSTRQQVWRGFAAFCSLAPLLFRPTLQSLSKLQAADKHRVFWQDRNAKQSLHPDRSTRFVNTLVKAGLIPDDAAQTLAKFVNSAFVRVCNTL